MELILAWLLADFISGVGHWAEDRLLTKETRFKFINSIKADNDLHHARPGAMLRFTVWQNMNTSAPFTIPAAAVLALAGASHVISLAVFFLSFVNLIHRWSHVRNNPLPIRLMQSARIFPSYEHHWEHHADANGLLTKERTSRRYCVMSGLLNPVLDRVGFWKLLEAVFI